MTLLDRIRIERAVQSYSWWLELRQVGIGRRRELRRELRANLHEATADHGSRHAVTVLGSVRRMAGEAVEQNPDRPRWSTGAMAAVATLGLTLLIELLAALAWVDGAVAAAPGHGATGTMTLFPGSSLRYTPITSGFSIEFGFGWLCLVTAALAFIVVARPWRAVTDSRTRETTPGLP